MIQARSAGGERARRGETRLTWQEHLGLLLDNHPMNTAFQRSGAPA
jgi:hypothetical protein